MAKQIKVVEKRDHHAVHAIFDYRHNAECYLRDVVPLYVARGFYMDRTLKAEDFEIIET